MLAPIAGIVTAINGILFFALYSVFYSSGIIDTIFSFPTPDNIIFNRIGFFDPNFINPTPVATAPVQQMQSIIQSLYYSCFTIATTLFIVAALVIGIKLALSTIAAEKAQYKGALQNWIVGIVLLFTVHFLMAGAFAINETIVKIASKSAGQIEFGINPLDSIPGVKTIASFIGKISSAFGGPSKWEPIKVKGYLGLIMKYMLQPLDLISSISLTIILFQTVALVTMYIKRLFYCIFLGILAPLVVALDVIKKSM